MMQPDSLLSHKFIGAVHHSMRNRFENFLSLCLLLKKKKIKQNNFKKAIGIYLAHRQKLGSHRMLTVVGNIFFVKRGRA